MSKNYGPTVTIKGSCFDCEYEHSEHYAVQGDSGCDVACTHPNAPGRNDIGDTTWTTPEWCPLFDVATEAVIASWRARKQPEQP